MDREYDIDKLVGELDFNSNSLNIIGKGLLLTNHEISILNKYKIPYNKCINLKEVLFYIDDLLNDYDDEELEIIAKTISERDYYQNTNK